MKVLVWPDPFLSHAVPELSDRALAAITHDPAWLKKLDEMIALVKQTGAVGLAANQVGWDQRVFVMDPGAEAMPWEHLNPRIELHDHGVIALEGCLSFPDTTDMLRASEYVQLSSQDRHGVRRTFDLHGLQARCAEHETDHLNGRTMLDRMGQLQRRMFLSRYEKARKKAARR